MPPQSICDSEYGLSLARGSFFFTPGAWTHVSQTVVLNTPGQQDGGLYLEVNGIPVINQNDVFYRGIPAPVPAPSPMPPSVPLAPLPQPSAPGFPDPTPTSPGGLLPPLLGDVLGPLGQSLGNGLQELSQPLELQGLMPAVTETATSTIIVTETVGLVTAINTVAVVPVAVQYIVSAWVASVLDYVANPVPIGFSGLFFRCVRPIISDTYMAHQAAEIAHFSGDTRKSTLLPKTSTLGSKTSR